MIFGRISEIAFVPAAASVFAVWAVGAVETALPVTVGMKAHSFSYNSVSYVAKVDGYKIKDCFVVSDSFIGWQRVDRVWRETRLSFPDDKTPNSSNPGTFDRQSFGLFEWQVSADATEVKATLTHKCGNKLTITTVGPFDLPGK